MGRETVFWFRLRRVGVLRTRTQSGVCGLRSRRRLYLAGYLLRKCAHFIAKPGSNTPLLSAFGHTEIVGLKGLSLRNLSAAGGQVSFVNRARPTKKIPHLLAAGSFIWRIEIP